MLSIIIVSVIIASFFGVIPSNIAKASNVSVTLYNSTPVCVQTFQGIGGEVFSTLTIPSGTELGFTEGDFQHFKARAAKMGLSFVRTWCYMNWWYKNNTETFESPEMQGLYRQLQFYDRIGCDVLLHLLPHGSDTKFEENTFNFDSMPGYTTGEINAWAAKCADLIQYIHNTKGINSVKYISLYNEPNLMDDAAFVQKMGIGAMAYTELLYNTLKNTLTASGINYVKVLGPDLTVVSDPGHWAYQQTLPWWDDFTRNCRMDGYTMHDYMGYTTNDFQNTINVKNANDPDGANKGCILAEWGNYQGFVGNDVNYEPTMLIKCKRSNTGFKHWIYWVFQVDAF